MIKTLQSLAGSIFLFLHSSYENKCLFKTARLYHAKNAPYDNLYYYRTSLVTKSGLTFMYLTDFSSSYNSRTIEISLQEMTDVFWNSVDIAFNSSEVNWDFNNAISRNRYFRDKQRH